MRKTIVSIFIFVLCVVCAHAETLVLRTGTRVTGTIVLANDEVVIIRESESGARYQYPRTDVEQIIADEDEAQVEQQVEQKENEIEVDKKASILIEVAGGAALIPGQSAGGMMAVDLLVGSHHIGDRHLFLGAGFGYHGVYLGEGTYNFLPIQAVVRMPFTERKHAPVFGFGIGYGVALSANYIGGIYSGADIGYRCQLNPRTALAVVAFAQFQQATIPVSTTIEGVDYTQSAGRNILSIGAKIAIYL